MSVGNYPKNSTVRTKMMKPTIVIVSGYFNPMHTGHLNYIREAKKLGDILVAIINNDNQVEVKGSKTFLCEEDRATIIQSLEYVDHAVISVDEDGSVVKTIEEIWNVLRMSSGKFIFANGGDQKSGVPEEGFCLRNGINMIYGVGGEKTQSSSTLLDAVS